MKTLVIDNFKGPMTIFQDGHINSGRSYVQNSSGANPFVKPGNLTWNNAPVQIDSSGIVITDLILDAKERVESGIIYVYAIGHTGRLYKIQVNDPVTYNPDYDNPVLLTTLASGTPTFTRGGFLDFFGSTEKIYIGHDKGVTSVNFDGTGESAVSGTWVQNVPRPFQQFIGKEYIGNGSNIAEIDSTGTVTSSTKLSPGFPTNTQVRDLDITPDGNYLEAVVSRLALGDITSATQNTGVTSNSDSFIFKWNGTDIGYTAFNTFPSFSLGANIMFQDHQYTFGTDQFGGSIFNPTQKILQIPETPSILPNSISSTGNLLNWMAPVYFNGVLETDFFSWGAMDFEVGNPLGWWDLFFMNSTAPETDIVQVPMQMSISNLGIGASSNGYANNIFGTSKIYYSTLETSSLPTTKYRFYKWNLATSPDVPSGTILMNAIYQTQNELLSKKVSIKEVRVYGEPWVTNNSFLVDLIGSGGTPMSGGSKTFTAGTNLTVGDDFAWYTPDCAPTFTIGLAITNKGTINHVITKVEIDIDIGGK